MIIDIANVTWERGDSTILDNVGWQVKPGEHWCLLGLNGSGKTTLLNMVNGYIWPTSGSVSVLGHAFGEYDLRELRKEIGWVSTSLQQRLYGREIALKTVLSGKNSTIGVYDEMLPEDLERAAELMDRLGCSALKDRTYETLSQGQRQRILIARALMGNPRLLILDEPSTGLDLFAREQLLEMISTIAGEEQAPTIIYVTHHVEEIMPIFTHTLLLKDGRVYAAGETANVLTTDQMSSFFDVPIAIETRNGRYWPTIGLNP
ncbi:ABC transporter ATP-binding protein [Paenibacillus sp. CAU 1782]